MTVQTLTVPSADEQQKLVYNRKVRKSNSVELPLDRKLACVILQLSPAVTQGDYSTLAAAIKEITGIQDVDLLVDGQTPDSIPEGTKMVLVADVQLRIDELEEP